MTEQSKGYLARDVMAAREANGEIPRDDSELCRAMRLNLDARLSALNPVGGSLFEDVEDDGTEPRRILSVHGLRALECMASLGFVDSVIARKLGVSGRTFLRMRQRDPRVEDALNSGRGLLSTELVSILLARARDAKHPSGAASAMFLLKTLGAFKEGEGAPGVTTTIQHANAVQINLSPQLTDEQFQELLSRGQPEPRVAVQAADAQASQDAPAAQSQPEGTAR